MKRQIIANIMSTYVGRAIGMVLGFFIVPFLIKKIGVDAFGVIALAESLSRFIELVSSSIRMALARHATFALAQDKMDDFTEYLSTGRVILFVAAGIVCCLGAGFSFIVPHIFKIPAEHATDSRNLFLLFIAAFTISFPNMVFWSSLYAKQRNDLLNFASTSGLILRALLVLLLFSVLPERYVNLTTYGIIFLTVVWADNYLVYWWSRRILPDIRIRFRKFRMEKVKSIFLFGAFTSIIYSSGVLYENLIQVMINILWGPRYNALYSIAVKFPISLRRLFAEPAWTLTPTFTGLAATNDKERLRILYFMYSKTILITSLPFVLFFTVMAVPVIELWVGPDFATAATMMSILTPPLLIALPMAVASCLYNAFNKVKIPSMVSVASLVIELVLGAVFAKSLGMGLVGISLAESSAVLLYCAFFYAPYACKIAGLSLREYWTQAYLPGFLWGCLTTGAALLLYRLLFGNALVLDAGSLLILAVWAAVYLVGAYRLALTSVERTHFRDVAQAILGRLGLKRI